MTSDVHNPEGIRCARERGDRIWGLYSGEVVLREGDDGAPNTRDGVILGRCKVRIPGLSDEMAWCYPRGSGRDRGGRQESPPVGAKVLIQFVDGDPDQPRWEYDHADQSEAYPEREHADVMVDGDMNFRFIRDRREGQQYASFQVVKQIGSSEQTVAELTFIITDGDTGGCSVRLHGVTGLALESDGVVQVAGGSGTTIDNRPVFPTSKVI